MDGSIFAQASNRRGRFLAGSLTFAFVGVWLTLLPGHMIILPMLIERIVPGQRAVALADVLGTSAFVGLLAQPIFGVLSDHTRSRWGMRKPWILGGALAGISAIAIIATAHTLAQLTLGWALMALSLNATLSGLNAIIPDQVPPEKLGLFSALVGFTPQIGILTGLVLVRQLAPNLTAVVVAQAGLLFLSVLCFVLLANDRRLDAGHRSWPTGRMILLSFWTNPVKHPDFGWAWLSRALVLFGLTSLQTYMLFYLRDKLGVSTRDAPHAMFVCLVVATVTMTLSGVVFGRLSDLLRRRKIFVVAASLGLALGLLALPACATFNQFLVVIAWFGLAQGCYLSVDLALVTQVLPDRAAAAKDMGVFHLANVLPQVVLPVCAPLLTGANGAIEYGVLFTSAGLSAALGAVTILFVKSVR